MATQQTRHLWAAAHALAATSPTVSAHLMTRLFKLSSDREVNLSETTMACAACGTITIPGWNSHVHTSNDHKRKASKLTNAPNTRIEATPRPSSQAHKGISKLRVVSECWTCGRSTTQQVPRAKCKSSNRVRSRFASKSPASLPAQLAADVSSSTTAGVRSSPTSSALIPSQNAGSKKRARSRKENSLSVILAAKKKQDSSSGGRGNVGGFGLDLMDLMKTG